MKVSLIRRFVALAALAVSTLAAQAHAETLAFEALYDPANGNISIRPFDSDTGNPCEAAAIGGEWRCGADEVGDGAFGGGVRPAP